MTLRAAVLVTLHLPETATTGTRIGACWNAKRDHDAGRDKWDSEPGQHVSSFSTTSSVTFQVSVKSRSSASMLRRPGDRSPTTLPARL